MKKTTKNHDFLPLIASPGRLVIFLSVVIVVAAVAFAAGIFVKAPSQAALNNVDQDVPVNYVVTERVVAANVTLPGQVVQGQTVQIFALQAGAARTLVTKQTLSAGQVLQPGMMLGEISGQPQIALPEGVPLYRDLVLGDTGADVSAFQNALLTMGQSGFSASGTVDQRTLSAVQRVFKTAGVSFTASSRLTVIPWMSFVPVPIGSTVISVSVVGTALDTSVPIATIKVSPDAITIRATALEAEMFAVGQEVRVDASGTATAKVLSIGPFTVDAIAGGGQEISVSIPDGLTLTASDSASVSLVTEDVPQPAIPLAALRQDDKGAYVVVVNSGGETSTATPHPSATPGLSRVYVTVTTQQDGWVAVEPNPEIVVGNTIRVSP